MSKSLSEFGRTVLVQFKTTNNVKIGSPLDIPIDIDADGLQLICDTLNPDEDKTPYMFFIKDSEIKTTLRNAIDSFAKNEIQMELCLEIICAAQAIFRVESVTRCSSSISGHTDAIVSIAFSPDGSSLASGSGDTTVRFWNVLTETPLQTCQSHKSWVLAISWSPDGERLVSGDKTGIIYIWNTKSHKQIGCLKAHKQWINSLAWEPYHSNVECRRMASASKDGQVIVWDTILQKILFHLNGHTQSVSCVKWGGTKLIYTASHDRTIKVWSAEKGILCRTLEGHAHWVNTLALSTEYMMRIGYFDPASKFSNGMSEEAKRNVALKQYEKVRLQNERLVSGSDDFTLFLWEPESKKKFICRMTGHQQLINDVKFSPDGLFIASASFDKSIKLWNGHSGKYITTFRGHVKAVYQIAWSADCRLLASCSADSTLKVWNVLKSKLIFDLPGHSDEVYALDWSPDGEKVSSGGKDRILKM
ncbi:Notchless -like protein 1 [Sarcoptes scabiei]|uniref:Notchless -like protein 1 n=1 Tax=Sarcoptes scabiei TaxID=52283 RepID=A0A132A8Y7_SARSC|nr:Notchless -like protein 1 [Sarcoptes scabiei]KPM07424.1 notchless protein-like protein [Sarcoptes scabiei]UXI14672.1 cytochrome C oxidase assembly protein [Sarcoptes scabiei]